MHTIHSRATVKQCQDKVSFSHSSLGCRNSTTHLFTISANAHLLFIYVQLSSHLIIRTAAAWPVVCIKQ